MVVKLINCPDIVQKSSRIILSLLHAIEVALQKTRLSSANIRQGMVEPLLKILNPTLDLGIAISNVSFLMSTSIQRVNK